MSFIKVTDPRKREELIKDFIETRKRIKDNFIAQKVGESEYQTGLTKLFKPVTEAQKATAKEITEAQKEATKEITDTQKKAIKDITRELIPIQEGIDRLPKVPPPLYSELPFAAEDEIPDINETVKELPNFIKKDEKGYKIGDSYFDFDEVNKIVYDKNGEIFTDSPKIYDILTNKKSDQRWENLNNDEKLRLGVLTIASKAIKKNLNNSPIKIGGNKLWDNVFSHIWFNRFQYMQIEQILKSDELKKDAIKLLKKNHIKTTDETKKRIQEILIISKPGPSGSGLILSSDPNALIDRFDLLFSSQNAGHTGVRNEIVSILDELKRQGVINVKDYKKLNSLIKNDST